MGSLNNNSLCGLVLCGGRSTRMGTDKGLLQAGDKTWAERAYFQLKSLDIPVFVSINPDQESAYRKIFPSESLIIDQAEFNGPLKGLMSMHALYPSKDLLVLACDMRDMETPALSELAETYLAEKNKFDFFVYHHEGNYEPLCGIYSVSGLAAILERAGEGKLEKHSMKYLLEQGRTRGLEIEEKRREWFRNYNEEIRNN